MGTQYLIDTNAVIELLGDTLPPSGNSWLQNIIDLNLHHLSVINQIELLSFNGSLEEIQALQEFIDMTNVLPLSDVVAQKTIHLRRSLKIKLPDAIIAATALTYSLTLITHNTSDFQMIPELICMDTHQQ